MALAPGTRLGPYEVVAPIGKGGMGDVYRARDTRVHREVAIKTASERFSERFEREAQAIAALNHPNVCTLYDVGSDYLVMELVEGPTLADRIAKGAVPLDESLRVAGQIADALSAAHRRGVIHRDLKPGNIKIKPDGTVKVLDFGLAKVTESLGPHDQDAANALSHSPTLTTPAMTQAGVVLGTAAYMSPEQAKGKPVDKTSDIWAFGVVLYEMLTGKQLHQGETVSDTLASVLKDAPDLSRVSPRVRRLLRSCLQKDSNQRLLEIGDWKLLLDDDTAQTVSKPGPRSRWMWPAIAALFLVIATAAIGLLLFRAKPLAPPEVRSQIPQPEGLTFNPGTQATISPDGRWLAFAAAGPDNISRMYIRSIDSLEVRPLPGSEGIPGLSPPPFWSYDSRFVVYGAQGKLKKSDIAGTPAQTIAETGLPFVQGGTWSRDGVIVYAKNNANLEQVSSSGGTPDPVTTLGRGETAHRWPQFLPDGRRFLYVRASTPEKTGVYVGSLDAKPDSQGAQPLLVTNRQAWWVTSEHSGKTYLLMQRGESLLAQPFDPNTATLSGTPVSVANGVGAFAAATSGLWSVARNGALVYRVGGTGLPQPTWVDLTGRTVGSFGEPGYANLALSPDGRRVAFVLMDAQGNGDVWVKEVAGGPNTRLTFDPRPEATPVWSPDGTRIVFAALRGGRRDLYEKNADGSGEERLLLQTDQDKTPTSWSRDGRLLLFISTDPKTRGDIWILPFDKDQKPFVFLNTDADEGQAQLSPDGRWIAYSAASSGIPDIFVRPFSADSRSAASTVGAQWMISVNGGGQPRWSADGKRLFYLTGIGDVMAVDIRAGASFQNSTPQRLLGGNMAASLNVHPTGDRLLMMRPDASAGPPPPFTLVLNWMTKLEQ
jgi:eukaryotic-like serine/threonine-protein kinase